MVSLVGAALLVLGILVTAGLVYAQGEVASACSSDQARAGLLVGHPDAQACRSYPPMLGTAMLAGLGVAALGGGIVALRR